MLQTQKLKELNLFIGTFTILLSLVTWLTELIGWVGVCPYCQVERSIIGIVGVIMLLPHKKYISAMSSGLLIFIGMHVASSHIFMHFKNSSYSLDKTSLVIAALIIMTVQISLVIARNFEAVNTNSHNKVDTITV